MSRNSDITYEQPPENKNITQLQETQKGCFRNSKISAYSKMLLYHLLYLGKKANMEISKP